MYPLVRELADDGIPVTVTCRVLKLARQPYYRWLACPVSDATWDEAHLANALFDAHRDDPEFGYRFLADEVHAAGFAVSERTVWRRCSENGWWSVFGKRKSRKKTKPGTPAHDDLVRREFSSDAPNELWLADITEHRTDEGKLYACAIKDVFSNRIVGYAFGPRMTADLAVRALRSAVARRRPEATVVVHSDRGGQFRSRALRAALKANGAGTISAACTHAVLSGPAIQRINDSALDELIATNTIALDSKLQECKKITVLSVARLLAEAITRIHEETSLSSLFV